MDSAKARADSAEARGEAAGAAHFKQIERVTQMHSADVAQLAQERKQWAQLCGQLGRVKRALHEALKAELGVMRATIEQESNNHRNAQEVLEVRGVCGLQEANAGHTENEARMAAEMRNIQGAYDASMGLLKIVQAADKMEARAREEAVRDNARMIEEVDCRHPSAEQDALPRRPSSAGDRASKAGPVRCAGPACRYEIDRQIARSRRSMREPASYGRHARQISPSTPPATDTLCR